MGSCRDNTALRKRAEKRRQHTRLRRALRAEGWKVVDMPIYLGHCGSVYGHELDFLRTLGITKTDALALLRWLHEHAIRAEQQDSTN